MRSLSPQAEAKEIAHALNLISKYDYKAQGVEIVKYDPRAKQPSVMGIPYGMTLLEQVLAEQKGNIQIVEEIVKDIKESWRLRLSESNFTGEEPSGLDC